MDVHDKLSNQLEDMLSLCEKCANEILTTEVPSDFDGYKIDEYSRQTESVYSKAYEQLSEIIARTAIDDNMHHKARRIKTSLQAARDRFSEKIAAARTARHASLMARLAKLK